MTTTQSDPQTGAERFAWRVLLVAFIVFVLVCISVFYLIQWFIFQSDTDLSLDLASARGTVSVILPNVEEPIAVTDRRGDLRAGVTIQTDSTSQAVLTFSDPLTGRPVASMVVFRDSQVTLRKATAPRFGLNKNPYQIVVDGSSGRSEILILKNGRTVEFELRTPQAVVRSSEYGRYAVVVTEQNSDVTAYSGRAAVIDRDTGFQADLTTDKNIVVLTEGNVVYLNNAQQSLLTNSDFSQDLVNGWSFYNDRTPPGTAFNTIFDGRPVVAIDRSQSHWPEQTLDHAETGLVQNLGIDVSRYDYVELRAAFYIAEQSLSTCGILASECPMTVRMIYLDQFGVERIFIHGFYAYLDPTVDYPRQCDTCRTEHERVNMLSWYTYESGNLLTLLPPEQRPAYLVQISFYASGHGYQIYVSEMSLLAE